MKTIYVDNNATTMVAPEVFEAMKLLHDAYWQERGNPGAFSNEFTRRFHRALIGKGLASKQVQLLIREQVIMD